MRVLVSAYACSPRQGSEPGAGWHWAQQIAIEHKVWILTRTNNVNGIMNELQHNPNPNLQVVGHDLPRWASFWKKGSRGFYLYYLLWQITAAAVARELHREIKFDCAQHVTIGTFRFPSLLSLLDVPYIWGPIGGGERPPARFYRSFGTFGAIRQAMRDVSNFWAKHDPCIKHTARRAKLILVTTEWTAQALPAGHEPKTMVFPQIGTSNRFISPRKSSAPGLFRLLVVSRLTYWKGLHLVLPGIAEVIRRGYQIHLTIRGEGADRRRLERIIRKHRLASHVEFVERLPLSSDLAKLYLEHDALLFPSLQDSGGMAVLEAMAAGMPVICLDLGGPSLSVTQETGIKIPAVSPKQVSQDMANAIEQLINDRASACGMGSNGFQRVNSHYEWGSKGIEIRNLYRKLFEPHAGLKIDAERSENVGA